MRAAAKRVEVADKEGAHYKQIEAKTVPLSHFDGSPDPPRSAVRHGLRVQHISARTRRQRYAGAQQPARRPQHSGKALRRWRFPQLIAATFVGRNVEAIVEFSRAFDQVVLKPSFPRRRRWRDQTGSRGDRFRASRARLHPWSRQGTDHRPGISSSGDAGRQTRVRARRPARRRGAAHCHAAAISAPISTSAAKPSRASRTRVTAKSAPPSPRSSHARASCSPGLDVIDGRLTEINVTSPTLVRELERFSGISVPKLFWDAVERKINR